MAKAKQSKLHLEDNRNALVTIMYEAKVDPLSFGYDTHNLYFVAFAMGERGNELSGSNFHLVILYGQILIYGPRRYLRIQDFPLDSKKARQDARLYSFVAAQLRLPGQNTANLGLEQATVKIPYVSAKCPCSHG